MNTTIKKHIPMLLLILAGLILISGCGQNMRVQINAFKASNRVFPSPTPDHTVAILIGTDSKEALLQDEVMAKLAFLLREEGYHVTTRDQAQYLLSCWFTMDNGKTQTGVAAVDEPVYQHHFYGGYHSYRQVGYGTTYVPYTYTIFCKHVDLSLYDNAMYARTEEPNLPEAEQKKRADEATVWQCTTTSCSESNDLRWTVNYLLLAGFEVFGQDTGKQGYLTVKERDKRFKALIEVRR